MAGPNRRPDDDDDEDPEDEEPEDSHSETYGEYLERTGREDTEQLYSRFIAGDLDDQED